MRVLSAIVPPARDPHDPEDADARLVDPQVLAERRARRAELSEDALRAARQAPPGAASGAEDAATVSPPEVAATDALRAVERERAELEDRLAAARAQLAERETRLGAGADRLAAAEQELSALRTELLQTTVGLQRQDADGALDRVRLQPAEAALDAAEERLRELAARLEAEQQDHVRTESRLLATLAEERQGFRRIVEQHEAQVQAVVARERAAFTEHLTVVREGMAEVRARLTRAEAETRARVETERRARADASARADAAAEQARRAEAERDRLRAELTTAREELAARSAVDGLVADLVRTTAALRQRFEQEVAALTTAHARALAAARGEGGITELEDELEQTRTALRPPPPMPPADHPALAGLGAGRPPSDPGPEGEEAPAVVDSVIVDLARAAARLRTRREEADGTERAPAGSEAPAEPEATEVPVAAGRPPVPEAELGPRVRLTRRPVPRSWLTPSLARLALSDPGRAAAAVEALAPVQADRLRQDLTYDLAIDELPLLRVRLGADGTASVAPTPLAAEPADFRLTGTAAALAPYAGGGLGRRVPAGVQVGGRRRRARRLARALRAPVGLHAVAALPQPLPAVTLLELLAAAVDPQATRGERFVVAFAAGDEPAAAHLIVADGEPLTARAGAPATADATVRTPPAGLAAFLGGEGPARVTGDVAGVERLLGWTDAAQGLDG